jgi:hypothetical protein
MYTRIDAKMAEAVNLGIALDSNKGAATAWAYMKYCKVPQQVILRVLAEPRLRRLIELDVVHEDSNSDVYRNSIHLWRAPAV